MLRVWFFRFCIPRPSLVSSGLSSLGHLIPSSIFRGNSLAPFDTLLMSNYLPISLLRPLGTQFQRKRAITILTSSGCTGVSLGSGFSLPALCQVIYGGRREFTEV